MCFEATGLMDEIALLLMINLGRKEIHIYKITIKDRVLAGKDKEICCD